MRGSHILGRLAMIAIPTAVIALAPAVASASGPFIGGLTHVTTLGSTVPHNGDVNPYGMAVVTENWGDLVAGNVLVSNFNAASNEQGTGTTIVQMTPHGGRSVFAHITDSDVRGDVHRRSRPHHRARDPAAPVGHRRIAADHRTACRPPPRPGA